MKTEFFFAPLGQYSSNNHGPFPDLETAQSNAEEYVKKYHVPVRLLRLVNVVEPLPVEVKWMDDGWSKL